MSKLVKVFEIRDPQGGRNFVRKNDDVKVLPGPGNKRSFPARFLYGEVDENGQLVQVTIVGASNPKRAPLVRTMLPTRIKRVAQTKGGEQVDHTRKEVV